MTPFIHLWIGNDYILPVSVILIICINMYIAGMLFAPFNYRQTMGLFVQGKMRPIISAVVNIVVSIIFAKHWGLAGVLWGTAVARLSTNVWFDPYLVLKKGLNTSPIRYYIDYLKKLVQVCITGALCYFISNLIPDINIGLLIVKALVTFTIANFINIICYAKTKEFEYLFNVLKNFKGIIAKKS